MDNYTEHMIKRVKGTKEKCLSVLYVLAILVLLGLFFVIPIFLPGQITVMLCLLCTVAACYGCYVLLRRQSVEYEYFFVNGEIDIDIIYSKRSRKKLASFRARDIRFCARMNDERYEAEYRNVPQHLYLITAISGAQGAEVYYVDFLYNAERTRLLFEPSEEMLTMMKMYNPRNVHIPEEEMQA